MTIAHQTTEEGLVELAYPDGRGDWLLKTQAEARFKLTKAELDVLVPLSVEKNPYDHNAAPMRRYNYSDIYALWLKLGAAWVPEDQLADVDGEQIASVNVGYQYKLEDVQMRRIKPARKWVGADGTILKEFNVKDVVALRDLITSTLLSPPPQRTYRTSQWKRAAETHEIGAYNYLDDVRYTLNGDPHPGATAFISLEYTDD